MITKKTWNRILIAGILLIVFVIIILALYVIPTVKADVANPMRQTAVNAFWFVIALQMIVLAELIYSRIFSFSEGHFENGFLVAAGFIALFLGLMLSDAAFSGVLILLFVCVGCDLVIAILAFVARYFRGHLKTGAEV
jgi:magnesium-transporting ATPase (P-type)